MWNPSIFVLKDYLDVRHLGLGQLAYLIQERTLDYTINFYLECPYIQMHDCISQGFLVHGIENPVQTGFSKKGDSSAHTSGKSRLFLLWALLGPIYWYNQNQIILLILALHPSSRWLPSQVDFLFGLSLNSLDFYRPSAERKGFLNLVPMAEGLELLVWSCLLCLTDYCAWG